MCQSEQKPCSSEGRYLGIKARDTFRQGLGKERGTNTKVEKQNTKGGNIGTMRIHLRMTESKKVRNSFSSYCDTVEISKYHQIICCIMTTSIRSPKLPIVKTKCPLPCTLWIYKCWLLIYMTKFICLFGTLSQVMALGSESFLPLLDFYCLCCNKTFHDDNRIKHSWWVKSSLLVLNLTYLQALP